MYKNPTIIEQFIQEKITEYITENPKISNKELAEKLGISERSMYRYVKKYDTSNRVPAKVVNAIKYLKSKGYTITKTE